MHWNNFFKEKFSNLDVKDLYDFRNNNLSDGMDNVHFIDSSNLRLQQFKDFLLKNKKKIEDYYQYFPKKILATVLIKFS